MKKVLIAIAFLIMSDLALARKDCTAAKIIHVQTEGEIVQYLQEGAPWRTLGNVTNDDGTRERFSALLAAQMSGRKVMVGYVNSTYDCSKTNWIDLAIIVRTYN